MCPFCISALAVVAAKAVAAGGGGAVLVNSALNRLRKSGRASNEDVQVRPQTSEETSNLADAR